MPIAEDKIIDALRKDGSLADIARAIGADAAELASARDALLAERARITDDAALLASCTDNGKEPVVGILVTVEEVFLHCAKALKRSRLWDPKVQVERTELPSLGRMILDQARSTEDVAAVEARIEQAYRDKLY